MLTLLFALATSQITLKDEGVTQGYVGTLDCVGSSVACTVDTSRRTGTMTITGGGGGGLPDGGDISGAGFVTYQAETALSAERVLTSSGYNTVNLGTAAQAKVDWTHGLTCSAGQALTSASTTTLQCSSSVVAATAAALTSNPTDCGANQYATTIAANGNLTCAQVAYSQVTGTPTIPTDVSAASYITKVAESSLSGELALGSLATGLLINTTTTGVPTIMGAQTCTNQFPRSSTASGTWTCSLVSLTADVTGLLPAANGGLGAAQPTCAAGKYLTCNGTTCSCTSPFNAVEVLVDFGAGDTIASAVVTGQAWVTTSSVITCSATMTSTGDRAEGAEDAVIEDLSASFASRVAGVGFTVFLHAPNGLAVGKYNVHCSGV